jgi:hypothetical protein
MYTRGLVLAALLVGGCGDNLTASRDATPQDDGPTGQIEITSPADGTSLELPADLRFPVVFEAHGFTLASPAGCGATAGPCGHVELTITQRAPGRSDECRDRKAPSNATSGSSPIVANLQRCAWGAGTVTLTVHAVDEHGARLERVQAGTATVTLTTRQPDRSPVTPMQVTCGDMSCGVAAGQVCCVGGDPGSLDISCTTSGCDGAVIWACDGPEDCGDHPCCHATSPASGQVVTTCAAGASCPAGTDVVCHADGDCPTATPRCCGQAGNVGGIRTALGVCLEDCFPDEVCPGAPACPGGGPETLAVGYAQLEITPDLKDTYTDLDGDGQWEANEPTVDVNGNGKFDPVWIAGYGLARPAVGVHDPLWSRALVLRQNGVTVAIAAVDLVGFFYEDYLRVREAVAASRPEINLVIVVSTHNHEGPDTEGQWGPAQLTTGRDPATIARVVDRCSQSIVAAADAMVPAEATFSAIEVADPDGSVSRYVGDIRDPVIINNTMTLIDFHATGGGRIATLVNWAAHTEAAGDRNDLLSSDFVHYLRSGVEEGFTRLGVPYAGTGAPVLFVNGAVGGQIGPQYMRPMTDDGVAIPPRQLDLQTAEAIGHGVAAFALQALGPSGGGRIEASPALAFRRKVVLLDLDNSIFVAGIMLGVIQRELHDFDPDRPVAPDNHPKVMSELVYLKLGPASILTFPAEMFPETFLGGYGGGFNGDYPLVQPDTPAPPDLDAAPGPPYLRDRMEGDYRMVFGLGLDHIGYVVPPYDFKLDPSSPYSSQAPGDHYEETESIGPNTEPRLVETARQLIEWIR